MDLRLIDLLVCPVCKGPLEQLRPPTPRCARWTSPATADRLAFPIRDGVPVMLENEARTLDAAG